MVNGYLNDFMLNHTFLTSGGDLEPSLGGNGTFFLGPRWFLNDFFPEKISDDLFLVVEHVFQILRFSTVFNVVYDPFFTRKTTILEKNSLIRLFYSVRTSLNIGGPMHGPSPHLKLGGRVPQSPLGLHPCF